jgi:2'-5' RNA ligase
VTRAFVAIRPPERVLDAVATASAAVDVGDARRTTRDQWHLTLQFLGDVASLDAVADSLGTITTAVGRVALGGAGAFPGARRANVLWIGIAEGADYVTALAGDVVRALARLGFAADQRTFHPHLTIARARRRTFDARASVGVLAGRAYGEPWLVEEVTLFESRLGRDGARYEPRAVVTLRA